MKARWVSEQPHPEPETIGRAIVASWWPMTYYWVSTIRLDTNSPMFRLAEAIRSNKELKDVQRSAAEAYVTNVYRCTRHGALRGDAVYERDYATLAAAQEGHKQTLKDLASGSLHFNS